jgi:hypothetical protein
VKKTSLALSIASLALTGCATVMTLPTSRMNVAEAIRPCQSDRRGSQACGDATFNATVISQIKKGQTPTDVRAIMRHDAERREVTSLTESWGYLTNYQNKMITWITFTDRKVTSLSHEVLAHD